MPLDQPQHPLARRAREHAEALKYTGERAVILTGYEAQLLLELSAEVERLDGQVRSLLRAGVDAAVAFARTEERSVLVCERQQQRIMELEEEVRTLRGRK